MSACRWSKDAGDYLTDDGQPCKRDEHGDRTYHCTARRTCSQHVGRGELTCPRCLGRVRQDIRAIAQLAALMPVEALSNGVDSESAVLAGPAADVEAWSWRKIAAKQGISWHVSLDEDDDDWHPYTVLTRWEFMLREDYGDRRPEVGCRTSMDALPGWRSQRTECEKDHGLSCWNPAETPTSITSAADYLDRMLAKVAQDETQDFPLLRREMRACRSHLEAVLHNSTRLERGAPCPECGSALTPVFVRLQREYGHWCFEEDCERVHYPDDSGDRWVCPRNRAHVWTEKAYRDYIEERTSA